MKFDRTGVLIVVLLIIIICTGIIIVHNDKKEKNKPIPDWFKMITEIAQRVVASYDKKDMSNKDKKNEATRDLINQVRRQGITVTDKTASIAIETAVNNRRDSNYHEEKKDLKKSK